MACAKRRNLEAIFRWAMAEGWPVEFATENVAELFGVTADDFTSGRASYFCP